MLTLDNLGKDYPTRSGPLAVLRGISLTLNPGDAIAITGPSGSGKSTLLQIIGTLDRPTTGTLAINGVDPFTQNDAALAAFRNRSIGFVFQDHHLLPQFNVLENVLLPTVVAKDVNREELVARAKTLLERVGLAERLTHTPAELSGGERQRVALARALVLNPPLLLADEPTGNLDRTTATVIGDLMLELHKQNNTILIVVTHSTDLAARFATRYDMADGQLRAQS